MVTFKDQPDGVLKGTDNLKEKLSKVNPDYAEKTRAAFSIYTSAYELFDHPIPPPLIYLQI